MSDLLVRIGSDYRSAEAHGILCGLLCVGKGADAAKSWLELLVPEDCSPDNAVVAEFARSAEALYHQTLRQLNHETLGFRLLLPDEQTDLGARTEALANWCQGFTYGLGVGGYKEDPKIKRDTVELIRDFNEISRASYSDPDAGEEEESAFYEIEEYVRVGVMLIMEELQPVKQQSPIVH
ncbi:MAG: UPF0149 family protein [Gammaproteobacteria bacterium]|nr:UPF0149 family protein [Gammaproteobacteria bacterium]